MKLAAKDDGIEITLSWESGRPVGNVDGADLVLEMYAVPGPSDHYIKHEWTTLTKISKSTIPLSFETLRPIFRVEKGTQMGVVVRLWASAAREDPKSLVDEQMLMCKF